MASSPDLHVEVLDVLPPEGVRRYRKAGDSFDRLAQLIDGTLLVGNGTVAPTAPAGSVDAVYTQAAVVAAPVALTGSAPAALTSAAITGGESPTEAEFNLLQADVAALRSTVAANVVDIAALRTTLAAALAALKGTGKPMASA